MRKPNGWIVFFLCVSQGTAFAQSLESETQAGASTFSEGINYSTGVTEASDWSGGGGYTYSRTKDGTIIDVTHEVTADVDYQINEPLDVGGGLSYSSTPLERVTSFGSEVRANYIFDLPEKKSITLGANLGFVSYRQSSTTTTTVRRRVVSTTSTQSINQNHFGLSTFFNLVDWVSFSFGFTQYRYSKDVQTFLQGLDSSRILANTGTSFPDRTFNITTRFYPVEKWDAQLSYSRTRVVYDGSVDLVYGLMVTRSFLESWRVGLGFDYTKTPSTQFNTGLLNLSYSF